ncbi:D-glucuronyl C5-epimerase family protein [Dictyobacter arantiisoli]|uniref:Glycosyl transferase family 1 domain-containing protein n=1 Tax=Dictyobacter arantiisoli TaxID=2014874 RepID=A0A5A5TG91_9CHLR|nr:D-glucuronyl C5-epimerase family protein [Dictyobacter arantiisoli]GCF10083.1 hypothetical protein KDI_36470 [Dictyobacter arantiisoli]
MTEYRRDRTGQREVLGSPDLLPYPIDLYPFLDTVNGTIMQPTEVAQRALAHWNAYLTDGSDEHKDIFLLHARWLLVHALRFTDDTSGWPLPLLIPTSTIPCRMLSALVQGNGLSVLVRAYQFTGQRAFIETARRVVRTFELDILDGGVSTPLGIDGLFFEERGIYPATHALCGCMMALCGLYDYDAIVKDDQITSLIAAGLSGLQAVLDEFDTGYWTYTDLLHKRLAPPSLHTLHILLLDVLASYSGCEQYTKLAARWKMYQSSSKACLRSLIRGHITSCYERSLKPILQRIAHHQRARSQSSPITDPALTLEQICVPIQAFPIPGGMKSVLAGVARAMRHQWQMTYLTNQRGQGIDSLLITQFGYGRATSPWQFPGVWLYCLCGGYTLFHWLRRHADVRLVLPQDGLYTAAFAALVGKCMGVRVVCMDHGNVTHLENATFRAERMQAIKAYPRARQWLARLQFLCYWPSLRLLARLATSRIDHFLVAGDEVEAVYRQCLGVSASRITRYAYMVDVAHFVPPDRDTRASIRAAQGLSEDAIVITLINRLALEKGLSFALEGIALAIAALAPAVRQRVNVLIAGTGPLQSQMRADITRYDLDSVCTLWGEAGAADVIMLLGITDIFLYSGTRGTNYSMAVLEAMAAGCAVVASTAPQSNLRLLAEGRGCSVFPADAQGIGTSLAHLCNNPLLCRQMGQAARAYVELYHSAAMLKRTLLRISHFIPTLSEVSSPQLHGEQID